jgi:spoIIIJ-associated protein
MNLAEQAETARGFLAGVLDRFEMQASIEVEEIDEETVEVRLVGDNLGLLIGPRGATLSSLQELARTVVQRRSAARTGRLLVDVGGYRQKRRSALERFARQVADEVKQSGVEEALEPMSPPDRKVIHDTINAIPGVGTRSQGEEPRRSVVVVPAED